MKVVQKSDETMASKTLDDSIKKISGQRDITSFLRGGISRRRSRSEVQDEGQSDIIECVLNFGQIAKNTGESGGRDDAPE